MAQTMTEPASFLQARDGCIVAFIPKPYGFIVACQWAVYDIIEAAYPEPRKVRTVLVIPRPEELTHG